MTAKPLIAAGAAAIALAAPAPAPAACNTRACDERVAAKNCSQARVLPCIRRAAIRWNVSYPTLKRKAWCESRFNPYARNPSGSSGLFQFLPSTWATTPYRHQSIWSAKYSALAAAWMHSAGVGRGHEWECK